MAQRFGQRMSTGRGHFPESRGDRRVDAFCRETGAERVRDSNYVVVLNDQRTLYGHGSHKVVKNTFRYEWKDALVNQGDLDSVQQVVFDISGCSECGNDPYLFTGSDVRTLLDRHPKARNTIIAPAPRSKRLQYKWREFFRNHRVARQTLHG